MTKKALSVLLALSLLLGAAPLAFASPAEDGWLIYYTRTEETAFTAVIVAPAKYTCVSDNPQIELFNTADPAESGAPRPFFTKNRPDMPEMVNFRHMKPIVSNIFL